MYFNKWFTFMVGVYIEVIAGFCYTFSIFSNEVKLVFDLSQTQLQGLGTLLSNGSPIFGWVECTVYDRLRHTHKLGPQVTAWFGLLAQAFGYLMLWAGVAGYVKMQYWHMLLLAIVASSSTATQDATAIGTSLRNFPNERGHVAGIQKAFLGLSASAATSVYAGIFAPSPVNFMLFLGIAPIVVGFFMIPCLNVVPFIEKHELGTGYWTTSTRFGWSYAIVGALAIFQLAVALAGIASPLSKGQSLGLMVGTFLILGLGLLIPLTVGSVAAKPATTDVEPFVSSPGEPLLVEDEEGKAKLTAAVTPKPQMTRSNTLAVVEEKTVLQCLMSFDFWSLWLGITIGQGAGSAYLNNVGQIVLSAGGAPTMTPILVSIFAIMNCGGRMGCGYVTEVFIKKYGTPRTLFMIFAGGLTAAASLFTAFCNVPMLYVAAAVQGFGFGCFWSLMMVLTSELFGLANFATNQVLMHFAPTVGSLVLATQIAGNLYELEAKHQGTPGTCTGPYCFRWAFIIIAGMNLLATVNAVILHRRTRYIYRKQIDDVVQDN